MHAGSMGWATVQLYTTRLYGGSSMQPGGVLQCLVCCFLWCPLRVVTGFPRGTAAADMRREVHQECRD